MKPGSSDGILTVLASVLVCALLFVAQHFTDAARSTSSSPDEHLAEADTTAPSDTWDADPVPTPRPYSTNPTASRTTQLPEHEPFENPFGQSKTAEELRSAEKPQSNAPARLPTAGVSPIEDFSSADRTGTRRTRTFGASEETSRQRDSAGLRSDSFQASNERPPEPSPSTTPATYKVVGIVDGDTVDVLVNQQPQRLRLNGIDTPEKGQPFGNTARDALSQAIGGRQVQYIVRDTDRYGRQIADIYYRGVHINRWLVEKGLAWHYKAYNNDPILAEAERQAAAMNRGLWADPRRVAPWNWRKLSKVERDQYR